jgi:hypothetical protein
MIREGFLEEVSSRGRTGDRLGQRAGGRRTVQLRARALLREGGVMEEVWSLGFLFGGAAEGSPRSACCGWRR